MRVCVVVAVNVRVGVHFMLVCACVYVYACVSMSVRVGVHFMCVCVSVSTSEELG